MFGGFVIDDSEMVSSKSEAMTLAVDLSSPLVPGPNNGVYSENSW